MWHHVPLIMHLMTGIKFDTDKIKLAHRNYVRYQLLRNVGDGYYTMRQKCMNTVHTFMKKHNMVEIDAIYHEDLLIEFIKQEQRNFNDFGNTILDVASFFGYPSLFK